MAESRAHYFGTYDHDAPEDPEIGYHLQPNGNLSQWDGRRWLSVKTPRKFFFYDTENERYLLVEARSVTLAPPHLFHGCDPEDIEVVTRTHIIFDQTSITIPLIGRRPIISKYSQIKPPQVTIIGNIARIDVSGLANGQSLTFSYISEGSILLVSHLITRLNFLASISSITVNTTDSTVTINSGLLGANGVTVPIDIISP